MIRYEFTIDSLVIMRFDRCINIGTLVIQVVLYGALGKALVSHIIYHLT